MASCPMVDGTHDHVILDLHPPWSLQQKEQETSQLKQEVETLQAQKQELLGLSSLGESCVAGLKERLWKLESSTLEQQKIQNQQENTIKQLEQVGKLCPRPCPILAPVQKGVIEMQRQHLTSLSCSLFCCGSLLAPRPPQPPGLASRAFLI